VYLSPAAIESAICLLEPRNLGDRVETGIEIAK
jgi:hypothetical protein